MENMKEYSDQYSEEVTRRQQEKLQTLFGVVIQYLTDSKTLHEYFLSCSKEHEDPGFFAKIHIGWDAKGVTAYIDEIKGSVSLPLEIIEPITDTRSLLTYEMHPHLHD